MELQDSVTLMSVKTGRKLLTGWRKGGPRRLTKIKASCEREFMCLMRLRGYNLDIAIKWMLLCKVQSGFFILYFAATSFLVTSVIKTRPCGTVVPTQSVKCSPYTRTTLCDTRCLHAKRTYRGLLNNEYDFFCLEVPESLLQLRKRFANHSVHRHSSILNATQGWGIKSSGNEVALGEQTQIISSSIIIFIYKVWQLRKNFSMRDSNIHRPRIFRYRWRQISQVTPPF